jgi:hypothetical protein
VDIGLAAPARLRARAERVVAELRRADRFARMRAAVVVAWVGVSLLTAVAACPPAGTRNALGAEALVLGESFVGGAQVLVRNDSDHLWRDVVVTIDGGWQYRQPTLRAHDRIVVPTTHFRRGEQSLGPDHRPRRVQVESDRGRHAFDLR